MVHLIGRSSPWSGNDDTSGLQACNASVVYSPRSGVSFWDLGDYQQQFEEAHARAVPLLRALRDGHATPPQVPLAAR